MTSYLLKCVLLGHEAVGKSSFRTKLLYDEFDAHDYQQTIGVEIGLRTCTIANKQVKAQIWDTAGNERFRKLAVSYLRGAHAVFLFFDSRRQDTFTNLKDFVELYNSNKTSNSLLVVICSKCDSHDRIVTQKEAQQYAKSIKALYFEFSASSFTQHQTQQIFDTVLSTLVEALDSQVNDAATHFVPHNAAPRTAATSIVAGETFVSRLLHSLKTMFLCTTCVVPSSSSSADASKTNSNNVGAKKEAPRWVVRECPCFECQKLPTLRVGRLQALRLAH